MSINLLIEHLLPPPKKPLQLKTSEPKLRDWPCKNAFEKRLIAKLIGNGKISKKTYAKDITTEKYDEDELTQAII